MSEKSDVLTPEQVAFIVNIDGGNPAVKRLADSHEALRGQAPPTCATPMPRWKCRACGCLWRDNLDGTVSLFDADQKSCAVCEKGPTNAETCDIDWFNRPAVRSHEWAARNCHMLARREIRRLSAKGVNTEAWEHVTRICEEAGVQADGILRNEPASPPEEPR